jgi:hypothetical protein
MHARPPRWNNPDSNHVDYLYGEIAGRPDQTYLATCTKDNNRGEVMKLSKIATAAALAAVLGAGAAPAFAKEMSSMPAAEIQAAVGPMPGQVQDQLAQVGRHLVEAERRSFYSPDTDTNFRAAQAAIQNGRYDQVVADLSRVQTQLESVPYWDAPDRRPW